MMGTMAKQVTAFNAMLANGDNQLINQPTEHGHGQSFPSFQVDELKLFDRSLCQRVLTKMIRAMLHFGPMAHFSKQWERVSFFFSKKLQPKNRIYLGQRHIYGENN